MDRQKRQLQQVGVEPRRSKRLRAANRAQILLTDVVDDCLEHIFMHLSVKDLLNIAHTNKQLKPAAEEAFRRKFGKKVSLGERDKNDKITFKLLRCFGHLISGLIVWNIFEKIKYNAKAIHYVNKHCGESLLLLHFHHMQDEYKKLKIPFANVEDLKFYGGEFGTESDWLSKLFPKVKKLYIQKDFELKCLEAPLHHLEELYIDCKRASQRSLMNCFRLNPQLRRLSMNGWTDVIRSASQHLNQLEHLEVHQWNNAYSKFSGRFNFDSLTSLDLKMYTLNIPRSAHQLKEFKLKSYKYRTDGDILIAFLKGRPTIAKLNISGSAVKSQILRTIAKLLPLLKEITFLCSQVDQSDAVQLVRMCDSLEIFRFYFNRSEFDDLKRHLGNEWQTSMERNGIIEIKRNL